MSNVLDDDKQQQILALGRLGWPLRRIERGDRRPARDRQRLSESGRHPGARPRPAERSERQNRPFPRRCPPTPRQNRQFPRRGVHRLARRRRARPSASACEPYRELIAEALGARPQRHGDLAGPGRRPRLHRPVRECPPLRRGSCAARRRPRRASSSPRRPAKKARSTTARARWSAIRSTGQVPTHAALRPDARLLAQSGAAAGVAVERADLGRAARARVSPAGRHRPRRSSSTICKEGVLTPDIYDPALNPLYRDVLAHYGVVALPCRVGDPDRKGQGRSRRRPRAEDAAAAACASRRSRQAQAYLDRWEARWADTRIHGTTKRQVAAMFAEEQPALGPLPLEPFRYYRFGERTVHLDGCVEVEAAYYGAPPGWIGQRVQVQWNDLHVRLLASEDRAAPARASARAARLASHRTTTIGRRARRRRTVALLGARARRPARTSAPSAPTSTSTKAPPASAASSASSRSPRNTARPSSTTPPRPRSSSACRPIAFSVAISNAGRRCR